MRLSIYGMHSGASLLVKAKGFHQRSLKNASVPVEPSARGALQAGKKQSSRAVVPGGTVALDVEYMHYRAKQEEGVESTSECTCAAWVALVDDNLQTVLKTECRPLQFPNGLIWAGGVPMECLEGAPSIVEVADQVQKLVGGKRLIGHGLLKDMQALGLPDHPDTYDTMCFPLFQNKSGSARTLRYLAAKHLGLQLHAPGQRHDPEVDATVLMRLYTQHVHPKLISDYGLLVEWYTKKTLEQISIWQEHHQRYEDDEE